MEDPTKKDVTLGTVNSTLDRLVKEVDRMRDAVISGGHCQRGAKLSVQVKVLWCAAGAIGLTLAGLALKVLVFHGNA